MSCPRCHGLMVVDHFIDLQDDRGHSWLSAWRCINCGDVVEPEIMRRRFERWGRRTQTDAVVGSTQQSSRKTKHWVRAH
jgi:hypothetical protein